MGVGGFDDLARHVGHELSCVVYGDKTRGWANVGIECVECNETLVDYDHTAPCDTIPVSTPPVGVSPSSPPPSDSVIEPPAAAAGSTEKDRASGEPTGEPGLTLLCECDSWCMTPFKVELEVAMQLRKNNYHYFVLPGHEGAGDLLVHDAGNFRVVRNSVR